MHFNFSVYSSILLIFFSHGIIFSFLLFKKAIFYYAKPNGWLGLFIFLCSIYLLPWMLGFAGWYSLQPYRDIMFYIPFQQLFFIGPAIFFYTQCLLNPSFKFTKRDWLHIVPGLMYLVYRLIIFVTDKIILKEYFFYANGRDKNLDTWYQLAGFVSMIGYFLLCLRYYAIYKKVIFQTVSFADNLLFTWIKKYLVAFLLMQVLWLTFFLFYPGWGSFTQKWWYYLCFSSITYYIAITGYANTIKSLIPFQIGGKANNTVYLLPNKGKVPGDDIEIEEILLEDIAAPELNAQVEEWKIKLTQAIEHDQLYKNPSLSLLDIAQYFGTNQTVISKMINQAFKMNFNDLINHYRVKAVIALFDLEEHKKQTLLGIAFDCGFNSKTTFNRCFKKYTGMSPKDYLINSQKGS